MTAVSAAETSLRPGPITDEVYKSVFRDHAAGVVVVTANGLDAPVGFTATSLSSVSLEPPLVAFAVSSRASAWPTIERSPSVAVHFLDTGQHWLAQRFATSGIDRFADPVRWTWSPTGEPVLVDCPAYLCCEIDRHVPVGDHHIVIARVGSAEVTRSGSPLVYHDGAYASVLHGPDVEVPTQSHGRKL